MLSIWTSLKICCLVKSEEVNSACLRSWLPPVIKHNAVKPVLVTTCIKRPPALRDHCSDTTTCLR